MDLPQEYKSRDAEPFARTTMFPRAPTYIRVFSLAFFVIVFIIFTMENSNQYTVTKPDEPKNQVVVYSDVKHNTTKPTPSSFPDFKCGTINHCYCHSEMDHVNKSFVHRMKHSFPLRIVYNRIPKCGSRSVVEVLRNLVARGRFKMIESTQYKHNQLTLSEQRKQARELAKEHGNWVFHRHMYFFNFAKFGYKEPMYINVVRDPYERYVSAFYWARSSQSLANIKRPQWDKHMTLDDCIKRNQSGCRQGGISKMLNFFCGHDSICGSRGPAALAQAKRNILRHYAVVGFTENLPGFFRVLEKLWPKYFNGASAIYRSTASASMQSTKTRKSKLVSPENERLLRQWLKYDYDLYCFIKQRFYNRRGIIFSST